MLHVHSFLSFDFVNYFDNYLIGFDNSLRFGFYLFGSCSFAAGWLDFCPDIGCFVGCNFLSRNFDLPGFPNSGFLVNKIGLNSFVGCHRLGSDWGILGGFVPDFSVVGSSDCKQADYSTLVELVRSLVVAVAVELLQLQFGVALVKLLDSDFLVDFVE